MSIFYKAAQYIDDARVQQIKEDALGAQRKGEMTGALAGGSIGGALGAGLGHHVGKGAIPAVLGAGILGALTGGGIGGATLGRGAHELAEAQGELSALRDLHYRPMEAPQDLDAGDAMLANMVAYEKGPAPNIQYNRDMEPQFTRDIAP